jgi:hypothetical protein
MIRPTGLFDPGPSVALVSTCGTRNRLGLAWRKVAPKSSCGLSARPYSIDIAMPSRSGIHVGRPGVRRSRAARCSAANASGESAHALRRTAMSRCPAGRTSAAVRRLDRRRFRRMLRAPLARILPISTPQPKADESTFRALSRVACPTPAAAICPSISDTGAGSSNSSSGLCRAGGRTCLL